MSFERKIDELQRRVASLESHGEKEAFLKFLKRKNFSFNAFLPIGMPSIMREKLDWKSLLNEIRSYSCKNTIGRKFKWDYALLKTRKYIVVCSRDPDVKDHLRISSNENFTAEELETIAKVLGVKPYVKDFWF